MKIIVDINNKPTEITLTKEQLKQIKSQNNMSKVYAYHNTTEEEFENTYKNIPLHLKYLQKEVMIVAYLNKGWKPDMKNNNQRKYYCWFYNYPFRFYGSSWYVSYSSVAPCFLLQDEDKCKQMVDEFLPELEQSRLSL
jgi:hypothetical protein